MAATMAESGFPPDAFDDARSSRGPSDAAPNKPRAAAATSSGMLLTMVNSVKSNIGIAVLAMPYAFHSGGWLGAIIALIIAASSTAYTGTLLVAVLRRCERGEYRDGTASEASDELIVDSTVPREDATVMPEDDAVRLWPPPATLRAAAREVTGQARWAVLLTDALLFIAMSGACIAYASFISGEIVRAVREWSPHNTQLPRLAVAAVLAVLYTPTAFAKRISGGIAFVAACGVLVLLFGGAVFFQRETSDCYFAQSNVPANVTRPRAFNSAGIAATFGVAAFSNEGVMALVTPIYSEMEPHRRRWYLPIPLATIAVCFCMNCAVGMVGLFCEKPPVADLITAALPLDVPLDAVAVMLLMAQVACTFPQVVFVSLSIANEWLDQLSLGRHRTLIINAVRVAIVVLICMTGGAIENVGAVVALFGGLANTGVTFVLPLLFYEWPVWPLCLPPPAVQGSSISSSGGDGGAASVPLKHGSIRSGPVARVCHLLGIVVAIGVGLWATAVAAQGL